MIARIYLPMSSLARSRDQRLLADTECGAWPRTWRLTARTLDAEGRPEGFHRRLLAFSQRALRMRRFDRSVALNPILRDVPCCRDRP
jgi:hypothetical protein